MPFSRRENLAQRKFIPWNDATLHVMSHVVNYGFRFQGIRCYALPSARPSFALLNTCNGCSTPPHYRIDVDFYPRRTHPRPRRAHQDNGSVPATSAHHLPDTAKPRHPFNSPPGLHLYYPWENISAAMPPRAWTSASLPGPHRSNTLPAMAKSGANYMNSQLIKMEAISTATPKAIALDVNGYVSEGSGRTCSWSATSVLQTAPLGNSVLPGITRDSVLQIARDLASR